VSGGDDEGTGAGEEALTLDTNQRTDDQSNVSPPRRIPISEFKRNCSAILRQAQRTRKPFLINRFGKPIAQVIPLTTKQPKNWMGSMKGSMKILGDIVSCSDA